MTSNQFSRNVWVNSLQIDNELQRNLFVAGVDFHWISTSIEDQAKMMFQLLILLAVGGPPDRSILLNTEFRGIPIKKLQNFFIEEEEENKSDKNKHDPVAKYVKQLLQPDNTKEDEGFEQVISQTEIIAESDIQVSDIDNICSSFKKFNIVDDPGCAVDIIKRCVVCTKEQMLKSYITMNIF